LLIQKIIIRKMNDLLKKFSILGYFRSCFFSLVGLFCPISILGSKYLKLGSLKHINVGTTDENILIFDKYVNLCTIVGT
jgi:hypothetical protein